MLDIVIENYSLFIEYTERKPFWFWLTPFHEYLLIILWWDWCFVPRSMCKNNMVLELMAGRISISQKQAFWQISPWKVSNSSKFQHCTRSQGLPLVVPWLNNLKKKHISSNKILFCFDEMFEFLIANLQNRQLPEMMTFCELLNQWNSMFFTTFVNYG